MVSPLLMANAGYRYKYDYRYAAKEFFQHLLLMEQLLTSFLAARLIHRCHWLLLPA
jgi:hypothetical protein